MLAHVAAAVILRVFLPAGYHLLTECCKTEGLRGSRGRRCNRNCRG